MLAVNILNKKITIVLFVFCLMSNISWGQQSGDILQVKKHNSADQPFEINSISKITFTQQVVQIYVAGIEIDPIPFEEISAITFVKSNVTKKENIIKLEDIKVYQSCKDNLVIESPNFIEFVNIYNIQGKLIYRSMGKVNSYTLQIQLSDCNTGVYLVQVKTNKNFNVKKIIKN